MKIFYASNSILSHASQLYTITTDPQTLQVKSRTKNRKLEVKFLPHIHVQQKLSVMQNPRAIGNSSILHVEDNVNHNLLKQHILGQNSIACLTVLTLPSSLTPQLPHFTLFLFCWFAYNRFYGAGTGGDTFHLIGLIGCQVSFSAPPRVISQLPIANQQCLLLWCCVVLCVCR